MHRRRYLRLAAGAVPATALAGCTGDTDDDEATPTGTETETETETEAETPTETEGATETPEPPSDPEQRVAVGDGLRFDPETFEVSVGDTVLWEWVGGGHNIKYDEGEVPEGTDWEGTEGSRTTTYGEGHTHWHTFQVAGEYDYYCIPHRSSGMTGSFTVTE
jgi:plastocyanin